MTGHAYNRPKIFAGEIRLPVPYRSSPVTFILLARTLQNAWLDGCHAVSNDLEQGRVDLPDHISMLVLHTCDLKGHLLSETFGHVKCGEPHFDSDDWVFIQFEKNLNFSCKPTPARLNRPTAQSWPNLVWRSCKYTSTAPSPRARDTLERVFFFWPWRILEGDDYIKNASAANS
jgi:hypothetical protein